MNHSVSLTHQEGMHFLATVDQMTIHLDAKPEHGGTGQGPSPKPLLLASLAGCTAMDVVSLLNKMRVPFTHFQVDASAPLTEEHPKVYSHFTITFKIGAGEEHREKIEKAINLSQERYCGVSDMLRKAAPITVVLELSQA